MGKVKKRLLSFIVSLVMVLTAVMPNMAVVANASQIDQPSDTEGTVYVSYSHDGVFSKGKVAGDYMACIPVSLSDLSKYFENYDGFKYDVGDDGVYDMTALVLFRYMLDTYNDAGADSLVVQNEGSGSAYLASGAWTLDDGTPWDENLNYYYDGMYPLGAEGWGATCDQVTLHDGDFIDFQHYSDWSFFSDEEAGYQYFAGDKYLADYAAGSVKNATMDEGAPGYAVHEFSGETGQPVKLTVIKAWGDLYSGGETAYSLYTAPKIYYGSSLYAADAASVDQGTNIANDPSYTEITFNEPGTYYLWTQGQAGSSGAVVNTPAYAKVTITGDPVVPPVDPADPANVTVNISNAGQVVLAQKSVTVTDNNSDGTLDVFEALYAAHEAYYEGGAAAGYATAETDYGTSITRLWGVDGTPMYAINHDAGGSGTEVKEGDLVYAYNLKDPSGFSDSYSKFDKESYEAEAEKGLSVELTRFYPDENWFIQQEKFAGASLSVLNADLTAVDSSKYSFTNNGEGSYTVTFKEAGEYFLTANSDDPILVPAIAKVTVAPAPQNNVPALAEGVPASAEAAISEGEAYTLDLSTIFTDADGDALTYKVKIGDAEAAEAAASYSFTPEAAGTYTLVFTANDGKADSEDAYTVTLTVEAAPAGTDPTTFWNSDVDGNGWYAWSSSWCYIKTVTASGVTVDSYNWDGNTCNVVLAASTYKDASFTFSTTAYARSSSAQVKINGANAGSSSTSTAIELTDGAVSVTVQPAYSSRTGTTKTFNFTIKGGGQEPSYYITFVNGTGYEIAAAEGYTQPVGSKGSFGVAVSILDGYRKGQNFKVLANGTEITPDENNIYIITNIKSDQEVTVEDVVSADTVFYWKVTLPESPIGYSVVPEEGYASPVEETKDYKFKVTIAEGYAKNASFAVKANGTALTADADGVYAIENINEDQTVTVEGVQDIYDVTLESGTGYTVNAVEGYTSPVFSGDSFKFTVTIADGYKEGVDFAVKTNGTVLTADAEGVYTISNIRAAQTVTVEDVVTEDTVLEYRITLPEIAGVTAAPEEGYSSPVVQGNDYKFTVTLADGYLKNSSFAVKANDTVLTADESGIYTIADIQDHQNITVTGVVQAASVAAPAGSTICIGSLSGSFKYTWYDPVETKTAEDGTVTAYFAPISGTSFYRVQNPKGVTYWDFQTLSAGKSYTVTETNLHMDDDEFNSDTYYHDFVYNYLDLADVYLNINERNYLAMEAGATRELDVFRNWQAIESFTNAKIAIPDAHYEVVDINGNPSDLVTVTPDAHNTCLANITAGSGSGMAVIKVTYDAMIHKQGYASGYGAGGADPTRFSAIWPECTGVIVVTVGEDGSAINLGMTINVGTHAGKVAGDNIDAEHDLLYYYDDKGAEYTFRPEEGTSVSIARCTLGERTLSYSGFTTEGITTDEEGNVTVTGLTSGRHIVKVEKDGSANYQVLSARYVKLEILDAAGNVLDPDSVITPGQKLTLVLHNVNSPQEKLATCYNNSFSVAYYGEDNPSKRLAYSNAGSHGYGQYNFTSMNQEITVNIPEDWTKDTYLINNGAVAMAGFSGCAAGGHRGKVTYNSASGMATGTSGTGVLAKLPDITLNVHSHQIVKTDAVDATCTQSGNSEYYYCEGCGKYFSDEACAAEIEKDSWIIEALGHDWADPEWTWTGDDASGYTAASAAFVCRRDSEHKETVEATVKITKVGNEKVYTAAAVLDEKEYTDTKTVAIEKSTAKVDFTSQMSGGFLHAPQFNKEVASDLAENYGYEDDVIGVSVLDVLVAAHELVFGEDFTKETAENYLTLGATGSPTKQFGTEGNPAASYEPSYMGMFFYNHGWPNDGTQNERGEYFGTTVTTQAVKDGDLVEFFFNESGYYADTYNWFTDGEGNYSRTFSVEAGKDLDLALKGAWIPDPAQLTKDEMDLVSFERIMDDLDGVQIYTVDLETGALTKIEDAVTDEGDVTLNFAEPGTYTITAYTDEDYMNTYVMTLTTINVTAHQHELVKTEAADASCTEAGNSEYYTCSECGKYFSDEAGTIEIEKDSWIIPALGHEELVKTEAKPATSTADGNIEYWTCPRCGKIFSDAEGTTEIKISDTVVPAVPVVKVNDEVYTPLAGQMFSQFTYEYHKETAFRFIVEAPEDANVFINSTAGREETFDTSTTMVRVMIQRGVAAATQVFVTLSDTGHVMTAYEAKDASCTEDGNTAYWECSGCGKYFSDEAGTVEIERDSWIIPAKGHDYNEEGFCTECGEFIFQDVTGSKSQKNVSWAYQNNIVKGTGENTFSPNDSCTRIQFVMMLWKMNGEPTVKGVENPFTDVSGTKTIKAIKWALKEKVINSGETFDPNGEITRIQIVMILWKLAGSPTEKGKIPFTDVEGKKTTKAVLWAYKNKITSGTSDTTFSPDDSCTRLQLVFFLKNFNDVYHVV